MPSASFPGATSFLKSYANRVMNHRIELTVAIFEYMRKHGVTLADLTELGGEDLQHRDPVIVEKARAVERAWGRIAAVGLRFVDLEQFASSPANFHRYPKQLKNQQLTEGGPKPSAKTILPQNQRLKNLPPAYRANGPSEPASATASSTNSTSQHVLGVEQ